MDIPAYQEAAYHFLSGIAIAFVDRYFSTNASRYTNERKEKKLEQLAALEYLSDNNSSDTEIKQTGKYLSAIVRARDYFKSTGQSASIFREDGGLREFPARFEESFAFYRGNERINNRSLGSKFGIAFGIEFVADAVVAASQIFSGAGNGLRALGESLYQGPSLFGGFVVGKGMLWCKDFFRSKEEKEIDELIPELTRDGKVLEMVRSYNPVICAEVRETLSSTDGKVSSRALTSGINTALVRVRAIPQQASSIYDGLLTTLRERKKQRLEVEEARKEKIKSRYDEY